MTSKKQQLGEKKASIEIDNLFRFAFKHLINIPADKIEEAVILVSYTSQTVKVFKELEGNRKSAKQYDSPLMCEIPDKTKVIYPTEALLSPEIDHNFFTINYIFKTVKRAKIMLVFSHNDVKAAGMKNIKEGLQRLVAIFKDEKGLGKTLAESCGIIIINSDNQMSKENYLRHLQKIYDEPKFIKEHNVKELVKRLVKQQKIVLFNNKNNNLEQFTKFVTNLPYLNLKGKVDIKIQTSIETFKSNNLASYWTNRFNYLYQNILDMVKGQTLIKDKLTNEISFQTGLIHDDIKKIERKSNENISKSKSFPVFELILSLLKIFKSIFESKDSMSYDQKIFLKNILNALYSSNYLTQDMVQFYFLAYFEIYRCLSVEGGESAIFQKQNFVELTVGNDSKTNYLLRSCLVHIEEIIHEELKICDKKYPFDMAINYIRQLFDSVSALQTVSQNKFGHKWDKLTFWTSRMEKKLLKYQCELQYKKTIFLTKEQGVSKITYRESWIDFITMAQNSTLIDPVKIEEGIMFLADELVKEKVYQQALKVYNLMPEYLVLNQIIDVYSFKFKIHPDFLKYTFFESLGENIKHLQDYCAFLLKIGFNQKVRELCYEGLRAMTNKRDRDTEQVFNNLLIKARSESSQNIHNEFLQKLILKERTVKIDHILLKEIRNTFKSFAAE